MFKLIMIALLVIFWNTSSTFSKNSCKFSKSALTWNCDNQNLTSIPIHEIMNITATCLNLAHNYIESIEDLILLPYRNIITKLILNNNEFRKSPQNLKDIVPNLTTLYLTSNHITHVKYEFQYLENLEYLDLDYNPIQHISPRAFTNIPNLKKVSLRQNNFTFANMLANAKRIIAISKQNPNLEIAPPPNFIKPTAATTNTNLNRNVSTNKITETENKTGSTNTATSNGIPKSILLLLASIYLYFFLNTVTLQQCQPRVQTTM